MMKTLKSSMAIALVGIALSWGLGDLQAKRGPRVKDPDPATAREAKVLGWGPVKRPNRGEVPEFLVRGTIISVKPSKEAKGRYVVSLLPIEALENHQRHVTFDHFKNGLDLTLIVPKSRLKELKKGRVVEIHQHYTTEVAQQIGGAKMVRYSLHQDIQGYPISAAAYIAKPALYPEQYLNAIKSVDMYSGEVKLSEALKAALDAHATGGREPELKSAAKNLFVKLYKVEPSGKCREDKAKQSFACL